MAIQAVSAPSERVFSLASRIISKKRAGLDPITASKLLFVSENWDLWEKQVNFYKVVAQEQTVVEALDDLMVED